MNIIEKQGACSVAVETCGATHHWGRVLNELGHTAILAPRCHLSWAYERLPEVLDAIVKLTMIRLMLRRAVHPNRTWPAVP